MVLLPLIKSKEDPQEGGLAKKQRTWTTNDLAYDVTPHKCRRKKEK